MLRNLNSELISINKKIKVQLANTTIEVLFEAEIQRFVCKNNKKLKLFFNSKTKVKTLVQNSIVNFCLTINIVLKKFQMILLHYFIEL